MQLTDPLSTETTPRTQAKEQKTNPNLSDNSNRNKYWSKVLALSDESTVISGIIKLKAPETNQTSKLFGFISWKKNLGLIETPLRASALEALMISTRTKQIKQNITSYASFPTLVVSTPSRAMLKNSPKEFLSSPQSQNLSTKTCRV